MRDSAPREADAGCRKACRNRVGRAGFTLIELLVAVVIMVIATGISLMTFQVATKAWERGMALSEDLSHGDFAMEQVAMALRSAYYPDTGTPTPTYGFWLEDSGSGESARDSISWVKIGPALVGQNSPVVNAPHRVKLTVEDSDDRGPGITVKVWRPFAQPEDFDPENLESSLISTEIVGFDCRVATNSADGELEWEEEWEMTNQLPAAVELTFYLKPLSENEEAVAMKRAISLPLAPLSRRSDAPVSQRSYAPARRERAVREAPARTR